MDETNRVAFFAVVVVVVEVMIFGCYSLQMSSFFADVVVALAQQTVVAVVAVVDYRWRLKATMHGCFSSRRPHIAIGTLIQRI